MLKIGTSGFWFKDWVGTVYPEGTKSADALGYYVDKLGFNTVEINSTYYTLVSDKSFLGMDRKTPPGFEFTVKAYRGITHDPFDPKIPDNIKHPKMSDVPDTIDKFKYSLQPIIQSHKLSTVLLQMSPYFKPSPQSEEYLLMCKDSFGDIPLTLEFRGKEWNTDGTYTFLKTHNFAYCVVDEPQLPRLMPFVPKTTSADIAYIRLHGRNLNWYKSYEDRYNYDYSAKELSEFIPVIQNFVNIVNKVLIFFNNCHAGSAAKNAMLMKQLIERI
ncbi:MAG: DUF72 domain-containing protein [Elusimicrobiota bacterium]